MSHTTGPLHVGQGNMAAIVYDKDGWAVCNAVTYHNRGNPRENARRIAAAWNLCQGIETHDIEAANTRFAEMLRERVTLRAERDDLLAALRRLSFAALCRDTTMGDPIRLLEVKAELLAASKNADAVIARVAGAPAKPTT